MTPELGVGQWLIWIVGTTIFGVLIVLVARAAYRSSKRPPEQPSAAQHVARQQNLPAAVQAELAALNGRKDEGSLSEAEYERLRAQLLQR